MSSALRELEQGIAEQNTVIEYVPKETTVRVALAGCGVVGSALIDLVQSHRAELFRRHRIRFEFTGILVRHFERPRASHVPLALVTDDVNEFLSAPADIVVEAMVGVSAAYRIARATLASGRRLVTANKALVAAHGPELCRLAAKSGGTFHFEASVGAAIPVVRCLREAAAGIGVKSIRGILNGTCNYILTRLEEGIGYAEALADAQARGFAEPDPWRDVGGEDSADKLRVLAWLAFGVDPASLTVQCRGIATDAESLVRIARAAGGVLKLVGECNQTFFGVVANVEPTVVSARSEIARVEGEENIVIISSDSAGIITLRGKGAGGAPTAGALLSDLLRAPEGRGRGRRTREMLSVVRFQDEAEDLRELQWLVCVPSNSRGSLRALGGLDTSFHSSCVSTEIGDGRALLGVMAPRKKIADLITRAGAAGLSIDAVRWEEA